VFGRRRILFDLQNPKKVLTESACAWKMSDFTNKTRKKLRAFESERVHGEAAFTSRKSLMRCLLIQRPIMRFAFFLFECVERRKLNCASECGSY
jgi:hypothetical protein